jgi:hypothetical protein
MMSQLHAIGLAADLLVERGDARRCPVHGDAIIRTVEDPWATLSFAMGKGPLGRAARERLGVENPYDTLTVIMDAFVDYALASCPDCKQEK